MFAQLTLVLPLLVHWAQAEWNLIWSDEFNGTQLQTNEWLFDLGIGQDGWGNNELEYYTNRSTNARVENGHLIIDARVEHYQGCKFTSARLKSVRAWTFGKFEARARLPLGHHLWPAFWMMPQDSKYGTWAASGEIDIMEYRGDKPMEISGAIHYGGQWPHNVARFSGDHKLPVNLSQDYHNFAVEWERNEIRWYVDGQQFHTENINRMMWSGKGPNPYTANGQPFDKDFYIILNVAVGGNFFGPGPYVTPIEARRWAKSKMEIDYVRVYQQKKYN